MLAWTHLARDAALESASVLDRGPRQGLLHGVPMGVKDIIDSHDQPTGYGSPIYQKHQPLADAATVALAKGAGAILLGKTVTTEFANRYPGPTSESAQSRAHAGRFLVGFGRRRRRLPGDARYRHADRRLGDTARRPSAAWWATSRPTATSPSPA